MEIRSLGFRTDLALLTATGSEVDDRGTHLVVRTPANPSYFWGNFLLLADPPAPGGEREVVAVFRSEFPDAEHVSIGIDGTDDPGDLEAWSDAGTVPDVATVLTAGRLVQPLATIADVEVRPLTSDDDWERRARLSQHLYPQAREGSFLAFARGKNAQERAMVAQGSGLRIGAFAGDELVSTAGVFRTEPGIARFQSVETHPDHRRQGLAATVVHEAGRTALAAWEAPTLVIVADTDDDAIRIYRRLGFEDAERQFTLERLPGQWTQA